jgi:hypothetical protein
MERDEPCLQATRSLAEAARPHPRTRPAFTSKSQRRPPTQDLAAALAAVRIS